ncbi:hypothetical protein GS982_01465 [Rhodococcus hoagii]|nr:hypothetical protein [Prescottella equi]NKZ81052.1 hypothetical protein [Prescottella equi]
MVAPSGREVMGMVELKALSCFVVPGEDGVPELVDSWGIPVMLDVHGNVMIW